MKEFLIDLFKKLLQKNAIVAFVVLFVQLALIAFIYVFLTGCSPQLFIQKGNTGSSISSSTSVSTETSVDSTKVIVPVNKKD